SYESAFSRPSAGWVAINRRDAGRLPTRRGDRDRRVLSPGRSASIADTSTETRPESYRGISPDRPYPRVPGSRRRVGADSRQGLRPRSKRARMGGSRKAPRRQRITGMYRHDGAAPPRRRAYAGGDRNTRAAPPEPRGSDRQERALEPR